MTTKKTRPALGELKPGQPVMIRQSYNDTRGRKPEDRYIPAVVVKASRVWIELVSTDEKRYRMSWRMRRDTQDEATQYPGSNASFATLDQHAWDETWRWARDVLIDHGIELRNRSPWRGREIEMANLLAKVNLHDTEEGTS